MGRFDKLGKLIGNIEKTPKMNKAEAEKVLAKLLPEGLSKYEHQDVLDRIFSNPEELDAVRKALDVTQGDVAARELAQLGPSKEVFHGTNSYNIKDFRPSEKGHYGSGVYTADSKEAAEKYGKNIYNLKIPSDYLDARASHQSKDILDRLSPETLKKLEDLSETEANVLIAKELGIPNISAPYKGYNVTLDPSKVRDVNALFDARYKNSPNRLASIAPYTIGAGAVGAATLGGQNEAEASSMPKLTNLIKKTAPKIDEVRAKQIAKAYDMMSHSPNDPNTKQAYDALIKEIKQQYNDIQKKGLKISSIEPGMENPYKTSQDLFNDVEKNNHMWFFPTEQGFGSNKIDVSGNPLLAETEYKLGDKPLLANDIFRIVHDYYGHVPDKFKFGARGEEGAWINHMKMLSPEAQKALTTETRGQNSFVNFGPNGEFNRTNPSQTIFADQKTGLLPDWTRQIEHEKGTPVTVFGPKGTDQAKEGLIDWNTVKNTQPEQGMEKFTGRVTGDVYDLENDPNGYLAKAKQLVFDGKRTSNPEQIAREMARQNGFGGIKSNKGIESFEPVKLRPSYATMAAPIGLGSGFSNLKQEVINPAVSGWEKLKSLIHKPLSKQLNLSKDPEQQETIESTLNMVADPLNLVEGPVGLGIGAMQLLSDDEEENKK